MVLETQSSDGLAPCWAAEKLQPHSHEKHWRGLWPSAVCRGVPYYLIAVKHGSSRTQRRTHRRLLYTGVCALLIREKLSNAVSQLLQEVLSMEQQWCGESQLSTHPQNVQYLDQYLMKPGHLVKSLSRTMHFVQSVGLLNVRI
jgi:hypothetical protein